MKFLLVLFSCVCILNLCFSVDSEKEIQTKPFINWACWYADNYANRNPENPQGDFIKSIDCELTPDIIYYEPTMVQWSADFTYDWVDEGIFEDFLKKTETLRKKCPDVTIVLDTYFVWNDEKASQISKTSINTVVNSLKDLAIRSRVDGLVFAFDDNVVKSEEMTKEFFKEIKTVFKSNDLEIVAFFRPTKNVFSYVQPIVFEYLDWVNVDSWWPSDSELINVAPAQSNIASVENIIDTFIGFGCSKEKLSVIIKPYGSNFERTSATSDTKPGSSSNGPAKSLIYAEDVILIPSLNINIEYPGYGTICRLMNDSKWTKNKDEDQKVPYAYNDKYWLSYDDFDSIKTKLDIVKSKGIAGVWIDYLNADDLDGECDGESYPVTRFVEEYLD